MSRNPRLTPIPPPCSSLGSLRYPGTRCAPHLKAAVR